MAKRCETNIHHVPSKYIPLLKKNSERFLFFMYGELIASMSRTMYRHFISRYSTHHDTGRHRLTLLSSSKRSRSGIAIVPRCNKVQPAASRLENTPLCVHACLCVCVCVRCCFARCQKLNVSASKQGNPRAHVRGRVGEGIEAGRGYNAHGNGADIRGELPGRFISRKRRVAWPRKGGAGRGMEAWKPSWWVHDFMLHRTQRADTESNG